METFPHLNYFAQTDFRGQKTPFGIKSEDRARHMYIIGKTGMGKSTLLENLAIQDIKNGEGLAFIDPHGKSAELLLDYVPTERIKDVIYFAPFDLANPIAFNIMEDIGPDFRHLVADGLMATFKKIWEDAWSARMEYILNNTLLALLEYPEATLLGVNRMLSDKVYRKKVVANITDPSVRSFWVDEFANYTERFAAEATPAIQNKVGQFSNNPLIRNIIGQPKSSFDLRRIMDEKKILIVNLSKGLVGEQNTDLLGGMLVTKIYLAAMSRANVPDATMRQLPPFYLYVDEFQSFANESFADILSEARKYKLSLTIAHQYIEQMPESVQAAVFGNVGTIITFRVGPFDAEVLETIFAPTFSQEDLVNLGFAQIYLTLMIDGVGSRPFSAVTLPPIASLDESHKEAIIKHSQVTYGRPRTVVEEQIINWHKEGRGAVSPIDGSPNQSKNKNYKPDFNNQDNHHRSSNKPEILKNNRVDFQKTQLTPVEKIPRPPSRVISLKDLGRRTAAVKAKPIDNNRSALRSALKDLFGAGKNLDQISNSTVKSAVENSQSEKKASFEPSKDLDQGRPSVELKKVKEIPEAVLKDMLKVDDAKR